MSSVVISGDTSGAITLSAPAVSGTNTATLPAATGTVMVSGNMPAFSAYQSSAQTVSSGVYTKVQFQTKDFDTNSNFDNATNYRYTPTVAGYYQISSSVLPSSATTQTVILLYKNGTAFKTVSAGNSINCSSAVSSLIYFNGSTDYVEVYVNISGTTPTLFAQAQYTWFNGSMVRSA